MTAAESPVAPRGGWRAAAIPLLVGLAGLGACALGALFQSRVQVLQSYLIAYIFWLGLALGCQGLLLLHHVVGGRWGAPIRRLLEAGVATLPLMLVLFAPLLFGLRELYGWARPGAALLGNQRLYLSIPFFTVRAGVCFAIWLGFGFLLRRGPRLPDQASQLRRTTQLRRLSAPGLLLHVLTVSFALWDWTATLDPRFHSTVYGLLMVVAQTLSALAFTSLVLVVLARRPPLREQTQHLQDLGNLTLAFVMLWAYLAFMQFLISWSGNLPEEARFYVPRLHGGFGKVGVGLLLGHFALPFLILLNRTLKRHPGVLGVLGPVLLVGGFLDVFWLVAPSLPRAQIFSWTDLAATLGIGALFVGTYLIRLLGRPLTVGGSGAWRPADQ